MSTNAFAATGNTVSFTANVTVITAPAQAVSNGIGSSQYRVVNTANVTVFMGVGNTSAAANASSVVVSGTGNAIPLLANSTQVLTFVPNAWFNGATSAGTGSVFVTPGDGIN